MHDDHTRGVFFAFMLVVCHFFGTKYGFFDDFFDGIVRSDELIEDGDGFASSVLGNLLFHGYSVQWKKNQRPRKRQSVPARRLRRLYIVVGNCLKCKSLVVRADVTLAGCCRCVSRLIFIGICRCLLMWKDADENGAQDGDGASDEGPERGQFAPDDEGDDDARECGEVDKGGDDRGGSVAISRCHEELSDESGETGAHEKGESRGVGKSPGDEERRPCSGKRRNA